MLNELPVKVMEGILALLDPLDYKEIASVSPKMWQIVEETPKKYASVHFLDDPVRGNELKMHLKPPGSLIKSRLLRTPGGPFIEKPRSLTNRMAMIRLFLSNATTTEIVYPAICLGIEFWSSLNMKVTRIEHPDVVMSFSELAQFIDHFKAPQYVDDRFMTQMSKEPSEGIALLNTPMIRSMERLHLQLESQHVPHLKDCRAKDMMITVTTTLTGLLVPREPILDFLLAKIVGWLKGTEEIDKLQIGWNLDGFPDMTFGPLISKINLQPSLGWIDRTYEGMELILRASDGQALVFFFDTADGYCYFVRSEYNFRRGRCLGSYQRNAFNLARISKLMALSMTLAAKNPALADDAKKKLREECVEFKKYNENVSERDLLIDSIWRPKSERRSPWGQFGPVLHRDMSYPVDKGLRHAYKFTKVFEETRVLPDVEQFKPEPDSEVSHWNETYSGLCF